MVRSRLLGGIILCVVCSSLYLFSSLCRHERAETRSYAKMSVADDSGHGSETMRIYVPRPVDVNFAEQDAFPGEASSHGRLSDLEAAAKSGTDVSRKSVHLDSDNPSEDAIDGIESTTELESKERADAAAEEEKDMAIRHSDSPPSISTYNKHCATPANDIKLPMCRFCKSTSFDAVTIYLEEFHALNGMYWNSYTEREKQFPEACKMPDGMKCILQHSDTMADVVFRMQWYIRNELPVRYCYPQIVSILNSEAEGPGYHERPQVKHAEVHIDFHITSEVLIADGCRIKSYRKAMEMWSPPNPSEHHGIAMFLSHCKEVVWRYLYVEKLLQLVKIDMHGSCFHNVPGSPDRNQPNFEASFIEKVKPYRAVLVFENHQEEAYISEKIFSAFSAKGVIPIYLGAPDVHMWLPGNHTYVDAAQYETPNALAEYIKLILTNDTVYQYHTTNYDTRKVLSFLDQHCPPEDDYVCSLCHHAYKLKRDSFHNGTRHCNCSGP